MQELVQQDELVLALVTAAHGGPGGEGEAQLAEEGQYLAADGCEVGVLVAPRPAAVLAGHDSLRLLADIGQPGRQLGERRAQRRGSRGRRGLILPRRPRHAGAREGWPVTRASTAA